MKGSQQSNYNKKFALRQQHVRETWHDIRQNATTRTERRKNANDMRKNKGVAKSANDEHRAMSSENVERVVERAVQG